MKGSAVASPTYRFRSSTDTIQREKPTNQSPWNRSSSRLKGTRSRPDPVDPCRGCRRDRALAHHTTRSTVLLRGLGREVGLTGGQHELTSERFLPRRAGLTGGRRTRPAQVSSRHCRRRPRATAVESMAGSGMTDRLPKDGFDGPGGVPGPQRAAGVPMARRAAACLERPLTAPLVALRAG
jgi:hypothetical protein